MNNKKFGIIFAILILIILGMVIYSAVFTIKNKNAEKSISISIDEFNDIIMESENFKTSKVSNITEEDISDIYGIEIEDINKFYGKKSILTTDASMYLLIEPKEGKLDSAYSKLEQYCINYENTWSGYLEAQYDIVVDRKMGKINGYIYLVISDDAYDIVKDVEK